MTQAATDVLGLARDQVLERGEGLSQEQVLQVLQLPDDRLEDLLALAHDVRMKWCGPEVEVEGIISLKTGVENYDLGVVLGLPEYMNGIWYLSLLTVGVAFLAGKGGFFFIVGGYVCYWILAPILNFQDLLLPLALMAVDLRSGQEVVLREGSVIEAVRATISLPAVSISNWPSGRSEANMLSSTRRSSAGSSK